MAYSSNRGLLLLGFLLAASSSSSSSVLAQQKNPIRVKSAAVLGNVTSDNFPHVYRDAGWESQVGPHWLKYYADTQACDAGPQGPCDGFASNTLAAATDDPIVNHDVGGPGPGNKPNALCQSVTDNTRPQLSAIISTGPNTGVAWYHSVGRPSSEDINGAVANSGVATITWDGGDSAPSCEMSAPMWDSTEPVWGDKGVWGPGIDGYVYTLGGLSSLAPGHNDPDIWLSRVPFGQFKDVNAYQYWNGSVWDTKRLTYPNYNGWAPATVITGTAGTLLWSNYYNTFVYVQSDWGNLIAKTASQLQGPWSDPVTLFTSKDGIVYAPAPQTHYDPTGKTMIIDYSIFSPIYMKSVKVEFE